MKPVPRFARITGFIMSTPYERIIMNKLEVTKRVITSIVGVGSTQIVSSIIKNNTAPETKTDQVTVFAGSCALGAMVADAARTHTDTRIDEIAAWYSKTFKKI